MTVRLAVRAQGDLRAIIEIIGGNEPVAARRFEVAFFEAVNRIDAFPEIGIAVFPGRAVRSLLLKRWGYWIFYAQQQHGDIEILTIRSAKMKPLRSATRPTRDDE